MSHTCSRISLGFAGLIALHAQADITTDGTLGPALALPGPDFQIPAELGQQHGGNLFHSFGQFDVHGGESATFSGPESVDNVIGRVTGGSPSEIDGTLRSTIPDADLYLVNPAGMVFGANARLDVQGSFYAGTADTVKFGDGAQFNAAHPEQSSFTSADPAAFGFLGDTPARLSVQGSTLHTPDAKTLSLAGGGVSIEQAEIKAPAGKLEIVSASGPDALHGDLGVRDSTLSGSGEGGGKIVIRGGQFVLDASLIQADTLGTVDGRGIDVQVDSFQATGGSRLTSNTTGPGKGGDIELQAQGMVEFSGTEVSDYGGLQAHSGSEERPDAGGGGAIRVSSDNLILRDGASLETITYGAGQGGDITARVTHALRASGVVEKADGEYSSSGVFAFSEGAGRGGDLRLGTGGLDLSEGGQIATSTSLTGQGGNLTIQSNGAMTVAGEGMDGSTSAIATVSNGTGKGGDLSLETGRLSVLDGGQVFAVPRGDGQGGKLTLKAAAGVLVSGKNGASLTGIFTAAEFENSGDAGDLTIDTGSLDVLDGGQIAASTYGQGRGGNLTIKAADSVRVAGENNQTFSNITAQAEPGSSGDAGDLRIDTGSLEVLDGGMVSASTYGQGQSGNLTVTAADSVRVAGENNQTFSNISAQAEPGSSGDAGDLSIATGSLEVLDGGQIAASTYGRGRGGNLSVTAAESVRLAGENRYTFSNLAAQAGTDSSGDAGDLSIATGRLEVLDGAQISASTFSQGRGGNLTVIAADSVRVSGANSTETTGIYARANSGSSGDAGDLAIDTGSLEVLDGGQISASTYSQGKGGSLSIKAAEYVRVAGENSQTYSTISAQADSGSSGDAGDLAIDTGSLEVLGGGMIDASTYGQGHSGKLTINAAEYVRVAGENRQSLSTLAARAGAGSGGDAGDLAIDTGSLEVLDGGQVSASTFGPGRGGNLIIEAAGNVRVNGTDSAETTGIFAQANADSSGDAGDLVINVGSLEVLGGGVVSASTFGQGDGGNLSIKAAEYVRVAGENSQIESTLAARAGADSGGGAGDLTIDTRSLEVLDGGQIDASTFGQGDGGSLSIKAAEYVRVAGENTYSFSNIAVQAGSGSGGDAGDLTLETGRLEVLDGGMIDASTFAQGQGGSLNIRSAGPVILSGTGWDGSGSWISVVSTEEDGGAAGNIVMEAARLELGGGARISTETNGADGGDIALNVGAYVQLEHSAIATAVRAAQGNGGNIGVSPGFIVLDNGRISANAYEGDGGNIGIKTHGIYQFDGTPLDEVITASSEKGISGEIKVESPEVDIGGGLAVLPAKFIDSAALQYTPCTPQRAVERSKFIVKRYPGRGLAPDGWRAGCAPEREAGAEEE